MLVFWSFPHWISWGYRYYFYAQNFLVVTFPCLKKPPIHYFLLRGSLSHPTSVTIFLINTCLSLALMFLVKSSCVVIGWHTLAHSCFLGLSGKNSNPWTLINMQKLLSNWRHSAQTSSRPPTHGLNFSQERTKNEDNAPKDDGIKGGGKIGRQSRERDISKIKIYNCNWYGHYLSDWPDRAPEKGEIHINIETSYGEYSTADIIDTLYRGG